MGATKLAVYAAAQGIDLEAAGTTAARCIEAYRSTHPAIAGKQAGEYNGVPYFRGGLWDQLDTAYFKTVQTGRETLAASDRLHLSMHRGHLYVRLPSGRSLMYRDARIETVTTWWGKEKEAVVYSHPRYGRKSVYGGLAVENCVQAIARDMLKHAQVKLEFEAGLPVVIPVHDELVSELDSHHQFPLFMECMTTVPSWAPGFVLDAEGGLSPRYAKSPPPLGPVMREEVWRNGKYHKQA